MGPHSPLPLAGCRVLVTRPVGHTDAWRRALESVGAIFVEYPTIEVGPPPSWAPLDAALARLNEYDWMLFTSASAARYTGVRLPTSLDPGALARPAVAAVGAETARCLRGLGFRVSRVPEDQRQAGLIDTLGDLGPHTRVLFPQALGGREELTLALRTRGCTVDVVPASATYPLTVLPSLPAFDVATFASPSALAAFVDVHGISPLATSSVVAIGPSTAEAARSRGLAPIVARAPQVDALIDAIVSMRTSQGAT